MKTLAIDVGSSSVKAALFEGEKLIGTLSRASYPTQFRGPEVEIEAATLLAAVVKAIADTPGAKQADIIGLSVTSPAWVAMDRDGKTLTPIITHQDRRSVAQARRIEFEVGRERHLKLAGNRPFPGGISSTTCTWHAEHHPELLAQADLIGHLNTLLLRQICRARTIDPSNASFTGLYKTIEQGGWCDELCAAAGCPMDKLPEIVSADVIAGRVTSSAATSFGLREGTPMMCGMIDTSAAMMVTGGNVGQMFHMCGSTDVLGVITDRPVPHERLLTRALGVGEKWMAVSTIAAAGSAIEWLKRQFFADQSNEAFNGILADIAHQPGESTVTFEPYLAGDRMSIEQRKGVFADLTLASTRRDMLVAVVESIARMSAARVPLFLAAGYTLLPEVYVSGGGAAIAEISHRDWPGQWTFKAIEEAGLSGLARLSHPPATPQS